MEETVLVYIEKDNQYLMLLRNKEENDINKNKWIGVGGHLEEGETPSDALIREVKEETNLYVTSYKYRGIVYFYNNNYKEIIHLYTVDGVKGELKECDEGTLEYKNKDEIESLNIWEGDKIFLKLLKENAPFFKLHLYYENDKLVKVIQE